MFRSWDLYVMGPPRFRCATLILGPVGLGGPQVPMSLLYFLPAGCPNRPLVPISPGVPLRATPTRSALRVDAD
nr:hypothetical protein [Tanacetum cinerariifolium]